MFELLELLIASPLGAAAGTAFQDTIYVLIVVADCDECGFNDLGKLLFGGLILAVIIGIVGSLLWRRARDNQAHQPQVNSIRPRDSDE